MTYLLGILAIVVGTFMVIKTEWIIENFGRSEWAERNIGSNGGSRLLYKLTGLAAILLSLMAMTGQLQEIIIWFFSGFIGGA